MTISFPMLENFSAVISSDIFLGPFSLSLLLGPGLLGPVGVFNAVPEVSKAAFISFHSFFYSVLWQ